MCYCFCSWKALSAIGGRCRLRTCDPCSVNACGVQFIRVFQRRGRRSGRQWRGVNAYKLHHFCTRCSTWNRITLPAQVGMAPKHVTDTAEMQKIPQPEGQGTCLPRWLFTGLPHQVDAVLHRPRLDQPALLFQLGAVGLQLGDGFWHFRSNTVWSPAHLLAVQAVAVAGQAACPWGCRRVTGISAHTRPFPCSPRQGDRAVPAFFC